MKMKMEDITIGQLQFIYTQPAIRAEGDGYFLRRVGQSGVYKYHPNLQIHVPCMGIPLENGRPINLLRGFADMLRLVEIMNLDRNHEVGFLFCRNFYINSENNGCGHKVCHVTLCDPEESNYILIITAFPDVDEEPFCYNAGVWNSSSEHKQSMPHKRLEYFSYDLVPIGFRNVPEGEAQSAKDVESVKAEVIQAANQYLGIEEADDCASNETMVHEIPGTTSGSEDIRLWAYYDDVSATDVWVVDECGRMLAPKVEDCKELFLGEVRLAEWRTWQRIPETALVLSWTKPSVSGRHEFFIVAAPDMTTRAQLERVASLEKQITELYAGRRSPYDNMESPDIDQGWGLWEHQEKTAK